MDKLRQINWQHIIALAVGAALGGIAPEVPWMPLLSAFGLH